MDRKEHLSQFRIADEAQILSECIEANMSFWWS